MSDVTRWLVTATVCVRFVVNRSPDAAARGFFCQLFGVLRSKMAGLGRDLSKFRF